MILSDAAIKNRTTIGVLICLIIGAGIYSYATLPRESEPDVPIPRIVISTAYEGVSPEDIESSVTIKIENELSGLRGVKEITSVSGEGISTIMVEFEPEEDIDEAKDRVKDKVDLAKRDLPDDADDPTIDELNIAEFPIIIVNISGPISPVRLKYIGDQLEEAFEQIPGVLNADVQGGIEREIRLEVDPDRLVAYNLSTGEILGLVPSENVNISAGSLATEGMSLNVRVPAEFENPEVELDNLTLAVRDGKPIRLTDIMTPRDMFKDRVTYSRLDGNESISVSIQKRIGANIIDIAKGVEKVLAKARKLAPAGVRFQTTLDKSKDIDMMIKDLENNILTGLILVVLVLIVFMGWRTSIIVGFAIPMSMLISFTVLQMLGYTLNMVVLFSLIMALGMLVDNAIVIVENIFRHVQLGYGRIEAAMKGASEVAWPVITSTATTLAAFSPLIFWPGIMGHFMKYLPITLIITLTSSLFVALIINPVICSVLVRRTKDHDPNRKHPFVLGYQRLLNQAIHHWFVTLTVAICIMVGVARFYVQRGKGVELFPDVDPNRAMINIRNPQGTSLDETNRLTKIVEERIAPYAGQIKHWITNVGGAGGDMASLFGGGSSGSHASSITLVFHDFEERQRKSTDIIAEVRQKLSDIPGPEIKVAQEAHGPPTGGDVVVRLIGEDFESLQELSEFAKQIIVDVPGLVNLQSDYEASRPELSFRVDRRRAMLLGTDTSQIGQFLKTAIFGRNVGVYRKFEDEYDITIRLPIAHRQDIEDIYRLRVPTTVGNSVPLSSLGNFEFSGGYGAIRHIDRKRAITLTADAESRTSKQVLQDVIRRLSRTGEPKIKASDILNVQAIAAALTDSEPPLAIERIVNRLDRDDIDAIEEFALAAGPTDQQLIEAIKALNKIIVDQTQFSPEVIEELELAPDQIALYDMGSQRTDIESQLLNRIILDAAIPDTLAPVKSLNLPAGYYIKYAGEKEEQDRNAAFLSKAFLIALLLIVMILVTQFNTLSVPMIIMITVLLSMVGVLVGLLVVDLHFGIIMTGVGVISLAGVVVNNAIVLLDYTRRLQKRGMDIWDAAVEAGATRLRPVLLTAVTTILGLIPMATGVSYDFHARGISWASESSQFWRSMAVAVIFGLGFATILTLIVVPTLYVSLYRGLSKIGLGGLGKFAPADNKDDTAA